MKPNDRNKNFVSYFYCGISYLKFKNCGITDLKHFKSCNPVFFLQIAKGNL